MIWQRKVGVFFLTAGVALIGAWAVPTVYGRTMAHLELARFRSQSASNRLWDSARIRAYKQTLGMNFAPPEAVLRIRRIGIEVPVLEGAGDAVLNRGVGHIPGTALPGETGNVAITGHRDGFFRPLKDIATGDVIELERDKTQGGRTDRYVVRSMKIVLPSDTSVLNKTDGSTLTLITCYPFYYVGSAPQRYIVQAALLPNPPATAIETTVPGAAGTDQPHSGE